MKHTVLRWLGSSGDPNTLSQLSEIRILVLRYDKLGDMITTLPALYWLHQCMPNVTIDVLASCSNAGIVKHLAWVNQVFEVKDRSLGSLARCAYTLRHNEYDAILCGVMNKTTESLLVSAIAGKRKAITITPWRGDKYREYFSVCDIKQREENHWIAMMGAVCTAFGLSLGPIPGTVGSTLLASLKDNYPATSLNVVPNVLQNILINASAGASANQWNEDVFVGTLRLVLEKASRTIVVTGLPEDVERLQKIAQKASLESKVAFDSKRKTQIDLAYLIRNAAAVLTPDTGVVHLCSLFDTPVFSMYSSTSKQAGKWLPLSSISDVYVASTSVLQSSFEEIEAKLIAFLDRLPI